VMFPEKTFPAFPPARRWMDIVSWDLMDGRTTNAVVLSTTPVLIKTNLVSSKVG
jgi:hypothetical protein